ncbi:hypothetical protein FRC00_006975, partial [Tulasnella sp. 408]
LENDEALKLPFSSTNTHRSVFKYGTQCCNSKTIGRIVYERLKLGDIILTECILNPRKPNGEKAGPFGSGRRR